MFNEEGEIHDVLRRYGADKLPWNRHPEFKGVHLKHLLTGKSTENHFSYHLVYVEAGCEIGSHIHEEQLEMHQVIEGSGVCLRGDEELEYRAGATAIMPQGESHTVRAEEDLYLFATFVPPLV